MALLFHTLSLWFQLAKYVIGICYVQSTVSDETSIGLINCILYAFHSHTEREWRLVQTLGDVAEKFGLRDLEQYLRKVEGGDAVD